MKTKTHTQAQPSLFDEIFVDNFAGGGGASVGIELATGKPVTIAINHDPDAIAMHEANHPYTKHYCESVWDIDPREVCAGRKVALAWFSPDCKHFSKAKGGTPVSKNIRGLAWVVLRWAGTVKPRVIILENVEEFQTWGPVRRGRAIKAHKGKTFEQWKSQLKSLGYAIEHKELKACDYGVPTIRKRFYLVARCDGKPIVWPAPTYGDPKSEAVKSGQLLPWRTAAECIDFTLPCPSIFASKQDIKAQYGFSAVRPLSGNTMQRIVRGVEKFVIKNPQPFVVQISHHSTYYRGQSIDEPLQTVTAKLGHGVVTPVITKFQQNSIGQSTEAPLDTVMAGATRFGIAAPVMTPIGYGDRSNQYTRATSVEQPLGTVVAANKHFMAMPWMLEPRELASAQGFCSDYRLAFDYNGKPYPKAAQVARIGNSVCPMMATALVQANLPEYCTETLTTVAELNERVAV